MPHDPHQPHHPRRFDLAGWTGILGSGLILVMLVSGLVAIHRADGHEAAEHVDPAHLPRLWGIGIAPFVLLLGCIAILPLLDRTRHWWESNRTRFGVAIGCGLLTLAYVILIDRRDMAGVGHLLEHALLVEYVPFIMLLFSLYVISGGIALTGDVKATPLVNTAFLAVGALIASFVGTTGASMLLIRPLLQTNAERRRVVHTVVFFIFCVSNAGGLLLPIGDPPLFLGYLKGVDFWWTLRLVPEWLVCNGLLLFIYFVWDVVAYRGEAARDIKRDESIHRPLRMQGGLNFVWLLCIVLSVAFVVEGKPFPVLGFTVFPFMRELLMLVFVGLSLATTPPGARHANRFNYTAILEVAALFVGIFIAMQIPVEILKVKGDDLGLREAWQFFWATGLLSAFLDNAPTYVVFFETAGSISPETFPKTVIRPDLLVGISLGSVFMGAMTYIGNGPNFMVKSIAEQSGVHMPSFFGFMFRYSLPVLIPVFIIITLVFLVGGAAT